MADSYLAELQSLSETYSRASDADLTHIKAAIAGASEASIIGVGSGGSYTVASLLCNLHELYTGRVSRPATPLEVICNPTLASSSPVFLISAEGKNPDITEALLRARRHSARTLHVITNRSSSPLIDSLSKLTDVNAYIFELAKKDGYLATNSLLLDALILARAYSELDDKMHAFPNQLDLLTVGQGKFSEWTESASSFAAEAVKRGSLIVVYSPLLRPIAADLESKLSESALLHCQLCDLRSFAHGRHLWLAQRPEDCAVLALTEPNLAKLWVNMRDLFPLSVPTMCMPLAGSAPSDLIAGLVAGMSFVAAVAQASGKDVARPDVPDFGRQLYYLDLDTSIPPPIETTQSAELSKFNAMGAHWPSTRRLGKMTRAKDEYQNSLEKQVFRAIIFDYDGTLCSSQRSDQSLSVEILTHLRRLLDADVVVGIASGRGGSIRERLTQDLPTDALTKVELGLYNGGWIASAAESVKANGETSELLSHVTRIMMRLKSIGVPIDRVRETAPYQVSVRFREGVATEQMWFVLADALRQAGLDTSSLVRSKHSIDVLAPGIDKSKLVASIIQKYRVDPYQVLTMGDQGAWPGNDASLLEHRFSLSVDAPSRRIDRGWKLAPSHKRDVDATLYYLESIELLQDGSFRIVLPATAT